MLRESRSSLESVTMIVRQVASEKLEPVPVKEAQNVFPHFQRPTSCFFPVFRLIEDWPVSLSRPAEHRSFRSWTEFSNSA